MFSVGRRPVGLKQEETSETRTGLDVDHRESRDPKGGVEGPETMRVSCVGPRIIGGVGGVTASRLEEAKESENKGGLTGLNDIG